MRIGFQLPDAEEVEPEIGAAIPDESESPWHQGLFDYFFELWLKFAIVYGSYAAIRDLIQSIF
ncbi:MAG: hypothetical protein HN921_09145 [Bacteroidetes bacterium]|jgi:hypothetical protein|nr:hypothetical protein [Bacteroidota bacterium]MBT6835342.1 hypothetical protein [Bacteroidota bacterium]MBT7039998.1 hypothetical protein [Bacteroidota bacterium]